MGFSTILLEYDNAESANADGFYVMLTGDRFFKSTNLRVEKNAIASIIAFDSKPGDIVSGYVFFEVPANHGARKSMSYEDGSRDITITL
ncbi:MAG: hypothetical protein WAL97_00770 [Halobacteriota archaeon]